MAAKLSEVKSKILFLIGIILAASGLFSPAVALAGGLVYGWFVVHHLHLESKGLSKFLLQASVVCLGFGMQLDQVVRVGRNGFMYTAISITFAILLGTMLGKLLKVQRTQSLLITMGTAICGGSAIAAVGPVINAGEEEMAVSLGTIFILNSIALMIFPIIGGFFHLTQTQFGLWAALAIHDTSSVVGATAKYGAVALLIGTTVKLARALWIVPVTVGVALINKSKAKIQWPWFILLFCAAAVLNSYVPAFKSAYPVLNRLGKIGLTVTLFLIGTGINRNTLRKVGIRPMVQGIVLWIVVASLSLWAIRTGLIGL